MPRFFCDYCDSYLTHDSAPGRQQHCRGWKHRENFKQYYSNFYLKFAQNQMAQGQMYSMQQQSNMYNMQQQQQQGMGPPGLAPGLQMGPGPMGQGPPPMFRPPPSGPPGMMMQQPPQFQPQPGNMNQNQM